MLSFALKAVWFALLLSGGISCWVVLWAFSRSVGSFWGPMYYCVAITLLDGIICLGMIWRMDPYLMPRAFCLAQIAIITFSSFLLTGICASFSIATTISVLWPSRMNSPSHSTLKWQHLYSIPLAIFPIICTAAQMIVVIKLDAAKPLDNLHCDISSPLWPKLLGYAAMPLVEAVPCFLLSVFAVVRISQMHKVHQQISHEVAYGAGFDISTFSGRPSTTTANRHEPDYSIRPALSRNISSHSSSPQAITSSWPPLAIPGRVMSRAHSNSRGVPTTKDIPVRQFHLPFKAAAATESSGDLVGTTSQLEDNEDFVTPTLPTFAPMEIDFNRDSDLRTALLYITLNDQGNVGDIEQAVKDSGREEGASDIEDHVSSVVFVNEPSPKSEVATEGGVMGRELREDPRYVTLRRRTQPPPPRKLLAGIWRLLLFQTGFWVTEVLLSLSTLICVIAHRPPMPFGTEHVAALLASWGPLLIFGHSPGVRKHLAFWRRPTTSSTTSSGNSRL